MAGHPLADDVQQNDVAVVPLGQQIVDLDERVLRVRVADILDGEPAQRGTGQHVDERAGVHTGRREVAQPGVVVVVGRQHEGEALSGHSIT